MDLEKLVAIDIHTHAWKSALQPADDVPDEQKEAMGRYFRYQPQHQTVPEMAEMYRKLQMAFVVFTLDAELGSAPAPVGLQHGLRSEQLGGEVLGRVLEVRHQQLRQAHAASLLAGDHGAQGFSGQGVAALFRLQIHPHEDAAALSWGTSEGRIPEVGIHVHDAKVLLIRRRWVLQQLLHRNWRLNSTGVVHQRLRHVAQEPMAFFAGNLDHATCSSLAWAWSSIRPVSGDGSWMRATGFSAAFT